jgi:hypothetical protein
MENLLPYIIAGLLGVSNMIIWGLYGDLMLEPFSFKKVLRSLILGILWSIYLYFVNNHLPLILVAFIVIAFERGTTEIYKALIRDERQIKYKIPSDLGINFPRPIEKAVGYLLIFSLALIFKYTTFNLNLAVFFIIAVFVPALGGMIKDAPYEGFYPFKFFRSPLVVLLVGLFLFKFFAQYDQKYLLLALWGGERIISECYKKVLSGHLPGKFKRDIHNHINYSWKERRRLLLFPYSLSLILIVSLAIYSIIKF